MVRSDTKLSERIDFCLNRTLDAMARGGLFDHVGGGFFRYSIDDDWEVPHFEKMLCDNALLLSTYSRAYRKYRSSLYRKIVERTVQWLLREMGTPQPDSLRPLARIRMARKADITCGKEMNLKKYGGSGKRIVFFLKKPNSPIAPNEYLPRLREDAEDPKEVALLEKLLPARESRKWEISRDNKRITAWNALLLKAFVDASIALRSKECLSMACKLAEWMKENLLDDEGRLQSLLYEDQDHASGNPAFLDDYAFWAEGFSPCLQSVNGFIPAVRSLLEETLASKAMDVFRDEQSAGFFSPRRTWIASPPAKKILVRQCNPSVILRC